MHIQDLVTGAYEDSLDAVVEATDRVHQQLLRVTIKDETGAVNLIFEGCVLCNIFARLKVETRLSLTHFQVTTEVERFQKYFPPQIRPNTIAEFGTQKSFFILVTTQTLPDLQLAYRKATLRVLKGSNPADLNLSPLYDSPETLSQTKAKGNPVRITQEQFNTLREILAQAQEPGGNTSSTYCVVLDSTSSYPVSNSEDLLMLLKVTDESIYPEFANVQVFHQATASVPKVIAYGDVMRLQNCAVLVTQFKMFKGVLTATISSQGKASRLALFNLDSEELTPYGTHKGTFSPGIEHHRHMLAVRKWASHNFTDTQPVLSSSVILSKAQSSECDVIARLYARYYTGAEETDAIILFVYDGERTAAMVVDRNREKMTKWLVPGDTVRIRSVSFEEYRLLPSCYTDILKVPAFIENMQVPLNVHQEEQLIKVSSLFIPQKSTSSVSVVGSEYRTQRSVGFTDVGNLGPSESARTKGFVVGVTPGNPAEVRGFYCSHCRQFTHKEFCPCGQETDVRCQLNLALWDGKNDTEEGLLRLVVKERQVGEFIGRLNWEQAMEKLLSPDSLLDVVVVKDGNHLVITGTSLKE